MTMPWPEINSTSTLVFGGLTVLVGWLSYRAGLRSHDSQVRIETLSLMNTTQLTLDHVGRREGRPLQVVPIPLRRPGEIPFGRHGGQAARV